MPFYIVDYYAGMIEAETATREEAEQALEELEQDTMISIWHIVQAASTEEMRAMLAQAEPPAPTWTTVLPHPDICLEGE